LEALAAALRDPAREVRTAAVQALCARGADGARAARAALDAPEEAAAAAALRALGGAGGETARRWLRAAYAGRVREAWEALLLSRAKLDAPPEPADGAAAAIALRFFPVACADAFARALRLAFRALAQLEDESVVKTVQGTLRHAAGRARADALGVLSLLGDREASQALAVLLEATPIEDKLGPLRRLGAPPAGAAEALARAAAHPAPWVRRAAAAAAESGVDPEEIATMQRLLALRQVSLLSGLSLERLQAVERIATEAE